MMDTQKERLRTTPTFILETAVGMNASTAKGAKTPAKKVRLRGPQVISQRLPEKAILTENQKCEKNHALPSNRSILLLRFCGHPCHSPISRQLFRLINTGRPSTIGDVDRPFYHLRTFPDKDATIALVLQRRSGNSCIVTRELLPDISATISLTTKILVATSAIATPS